MPTELADGLGVERSPPAIKADSPLARRKLIAERVIATEAESETFGPADRIPQRAASSRARHSPHDGFSALWGCLPKLRRLNEGGKNKPQPGDVKEYLGWGKSQPVAILP